MVKKKSGPVPAIHGGETVKVIKTELVNGKVRIEFEGGSFSEIALPGEQPVLNFPERLGDLERDCLALMKNHWPCKPDRVSIQDWENIENRLKYVCQGSLSQNTPAESRWALDALRCFCDLKKQIELLGRDAEKAYTAMWLAMYVGQAMQLISTQIAVGREVAFARDNKAGRLKGNSTQEVERSADRQRAKQIYIQAKALGENDKAIWHRLRSKHGIDYDDRTFKRWKKEKWKIT